MLEYAIVAFAIGISAFITTSCWRDHKKKRTLSRYPHISFILPTYNDGKHLKKCIKSIYDSYPGKFDVTVINDCSTDNTKEILKELHKKYRFKLIENQKNLGKTISINKAAKKSQGAIIFIVDTDLILTKELVEDILARMEDKNVAAASGMYYPVGDSFLNLMQEMEYSAQAALNKKLSKSLYGGCCAIKRDLLEKMNYFKKEAVVEDYDLSVRLKKAGYDVQQSFCPAYNFPYTEPKKIMKQEMRWYSGVVQLWIENIDGIKSPISGIVGLLVIALAFLIFSFINFELSCSTFSCMLPHLIPLAVGLPLAYLPTFLIDKEKIKKIYPLFAIYPFAYLYVPALALLGIVSAPVGVYKYLKLKKGDKIGWQGDD